MGINLSIFDIKKQTWSIAIDLMTRETQHLARILVSGETMIDLQGSRFHNMVTSYI